MEVRWKCPGCRAENVGTTDVDTAACAGCNDTFFWESVAWVHVTPAVPSDEEVPR